MIPWWWLLIVATVAGSICFVLGAVMATGAEADRRTEKATAQRRTNAPDDGICPCKFCGRKPHIHEDEQMYDDDPFWVAECHCREYPNNSGFRDTREAAIKSWNEKNKKES